ncbi:MAG: quinolinate synthase NadA [Fusobacteria bacterium]|nr:quinolinate synthase NadA [Fusobacteriota bacterium]
MNEIQNKILKLKKEKNALILAHYYQTIDIQEVADFVGDSFELAKIAQKAEEPLIVLCGVRFMAESAKILNPDKKVLLPNKDAGCLMADMITPSDVIKMKEEHPDAAVMCYVNSTSETKTHCDICCTSSSAVKIAKALKEKEIIFIPDRNLGSFVAEQVPEKEFYFYRGFCPIHNVVRDEEVASARKKYPDALVLVHPECNKAVRDAADYVGSTSGIIKYVQESPCKEFIIGTEIGVVERINKYLEGKIAYLLSTHLSCVNMKKTKIGDVLNALTNEEENIELDQEIMNKARFTLERMVNIK